MATYTEAETDDIETFEVEQELAECDEAIAQKEIDFAYDVEISINGDREIVEPLLAENFTKAKFYHHEWDGNSFSAWLLMIDESGLRIRVNYGAGGYYLSTSVDVLKSFINENKKTTRR